ncbi:MAG TPA: alpha/beta hydrolase [Saprospiraceae bacterium]|nr:alpha/beta hydrolase [Saprospiraceae bacterium]
MTILIVLLWANLSRVIRLFVLQPEVLEKDYTFHLNYPFEEINIKTPDGAELNGLWMPIQNAKATILYFHGNRDNLVRWVEIAQQYKKYGTNVLVVDYRSYGKSTGKVTEENLLQDAILWYDKAILLGDNKKIILFGRSLGTGFAIYVAHQKKVAGLILETPFTSMVEVIDAHAPYFIAKRTELKLKNVDFLSEIKVPTIIFHGTADEVIPYEIGRKVDSLIDQEYATMITIPSGGHNNLGNHTEYWRSLDQWMGNLLISKNVSIESKDE